ncbi:MAG: hypothetical protein J6B92_01785 [Paraprevotella sp.]|nr:hypothetical protein [Paraprevotella sp.]MBP3471351.1 hypothetical protein [Paraprevotella sp.]
MKKEFLLFLSVFSMLTDIAVSQVREIISFSEKFQPPTEDITVTGTLSKEQRFSNTICGIINLTFDETLPDTMRISLQAAASIWENYLDNEANINIRVDYVDELSDADIVTSVVYVGGGEPFINYPQSLYYYINNDLNNNGYPFDAIVQINKHTKWDCNLGGTFSPNTNNLAYAMMRAIATTLGFGSSVRNSKGAISLSGKNIYSVFDKCIFSSENQRMEDVSIHQLPAFVQPPQGISIYALKQDERYSLYAPPVFDPNKSLKYLNDPSSLMYHNLQTGDKKLQIDAVTLELLENLGWHIRYEKELEIIAHNIPENGIASAYTSYSFSLKNNLGGLLSNVKWEYHLQNAQGEYEVISEGSGVSFSISPLEDEDQYRDNINGCVAGRIFCNGEIDGRKVEAIYNITLDLKPRIEKLYVKQLKYEDNGYFYTVDFIVQYKGATSAYVTIEEEFSSALRCQFLNEPYLAHGRADKINSAYCAWIDVEIENKYGKDTGTLEFKPHPKAVPIQLDKPYLSEEELSKNKVPGDNSDYLNFGLNSDEVDIRVFDKNGVFIKSIKDKSEISGMAPGLYLLRYYQNGICNESETYYNK